MKALRIVLVVVVVAAGCLTWWLMRRPAKPHLTVTQPFTTNFTASEASAVTLAQGDSVRTLAAASPFYNGAIALPGQQTGELDALRAQKIADITGQAETLVKTVAAMAPQVDTLHGAYLAYLGAATKADPKLNRLAKLSLSGLLAQQTRVDLIAASYRSLQPQGDHPFATSFIQYRKVLKALELGCAALEQVSNLSCYAAIGFSQGEKSQNAAVRDAAAKLDGEMAKLDGVNDNAREIFAHLHAIRLGIKQLTTGDYYIARGAVQYMKNELPTLQQKVNALTAKETLTPERLALVKTFACELTDAVATAEKMLGEVDTAQLAPLPAPAPGAMPCAYAARDTDLFEKGAESYTAISKGSQPGEFKSFVWQTVKSVPGTLVEVTELGVKSILRTGLGAANGNTIEEIKKDVQGYCDETSNRFQNSMQGSQVFTTAKKGMEGVEDATKNSTEDFVRDQLGDPLNTKNLLVPRIAGQFAKALTGLFTGFAKGVYTVANPGATSGDYVEGGLEIGCSMLGGSKLLGTSTMLGKAGGKIMGWLGPKVTGMIGNAIEGRITTATMASLSFAANALKKELGVMMKAGGNAWMKNVGATLSDSLFNFAKKQFTLSMSGLLQSLTTVTGTSMAQIFDNLTGQMLDDCVKAMVKEALADNADGTYTGSIAGKAGGTITVTISGNSVTGTISGSYDSDGFYGSISGSYNPGYSTLACSLSGHIGDEKYGENFTGKLSGKSKDGKLSGSWSAHNKYGSPTGTWSAAK